MPDFGPSDLQNFRADVRAWLKDNFPASLAHNDEAFADNESARTAARADLETWRTRLADKGWGVPTWPQHLGGGGLSAAEARALGEEMAAVGARNPIGGMGVIMFGP